MKVVHLTYDMRIGGTETVIKSIFDGFEGKSVDMEILCIEGHLGPFGQQLQQSGVKITNLNWLGGFDKVLIRQIRQFLKENNVDILHCHQYSPWFYGVFAAAFLKTKVIFTEHGRFYPDRTSWKRRIINPVLLAFTNKVTAISEATKQALLDYEYIPLKRTRVIYNGIKPLVPDNVAKQRQKEQLGVSENTILFGTVARLARIKNQKMMINAFAEAFKAGVNCKLLIVGDGEEFESLRSLTKKLDLVEHIIFTGYQAEPINFIAAIDIFLLSSFSEGTSMTLLEAMSLSKPCIVTNAGGNKEVIKHQSNGLVTKNDDVNEFSQAMIELLEQPNKVNAMGQAALKRFEQMFTVKQMTEQFQKLYDECQ